MSKKNTVPSDPVKAPRDPLKARRAAGLRLMGYTVADAAKAVSVAKSTLEKWMQCSWWSGMLDEARAEYLGDIVCQARLALMAQIRMGDGKLAFRVLERLDPDFAPPAMRHEVSGPDGGAIEVSSSLDLSLLSDEELDALDEILERAERPGVE